MNNIFDYALNSIFRYGLKNILITIIFGILVFLLSSVIFITNSLKAEYKGISANLPDILVQRYYGGKAHFIDEKMVDEFLLMPSVSSVQPRIWGQYHFERESVYLTLFGVQSYQKHFDKSIDEIAPFCQIRSFDGQWTRHLANKRFCLQLTILVVQGQSQAQMLFRLEKTLWQFVHKVKSLLLPLLHL